MPRTVLEVDHLHALGALGATCFTDPQALFDQGLGLLVRQLGVDRAVLASQAGGELESLWCVEAGAERPGGENRVPEPGLGFCPEVLRQPAATLVISNSAQDPRWKAHPGWQSQGIRAYVGAPLRSSGRTHGVLSVQSEAARVWQPSEIALVNVLAVLLGQALEAESLKAQLAQTQAFLELATAVVEDQSMESRRTGLPSRRFLEIWCRSHLVQARRRREVVALAAWTLASAPGRNEALKQLAASLRGVDLLVDLDRDRFLLVLPRTSRAGAEVVLERVRQVLGPVPVGATLWNPLLEPDRDAPTLEPAIRRAQAAEPGGVEARARGDHDGTVAWSMLEPDRASFLEKAGQW
ncbi:MAG: GAF domain-containing protein [Holophaga sp.]